METHPSKTNFRDYGTTRQKVNYEVIELQTQAQGITPKLGLFPSPLLFKIM
jgi:hypothetical protein